MVVESKISIREEDPTTGVLFSKTNLISHSNVVLCGQSLMQDSSLYFSLLSIRELFSISHLQYIINFLQPQPTPTFVINISSRMDGWMDFSVIGDNIINVQL